MVERNDDSASSIGRVLIALSAAEYAEQAVNTALSVAQSLHAELAGLFVEDVNLLRLAELPFARETGIATAASRPLEMAHIQRMLRDQAQRLERVLAAAAQRSQLPWSFAVARGQLLAEAFAREADLLLLAGAFGPARLWPVPAVANAAKGPVVAVFDASPGAYRTLSAAMSFAQQRGIAMLVVILAADGAQFERGREQVQQWLARRGISARYLHAAQLDPQRLLELAGSERAACLLLPQASEVVRQHAFATLLAGLNCPVFVAR